MQRYNIYATGGTVIHEDVAFLYLYCLDLYVVIKMIFFIMIYHTLFFFTDIETSTDSFHFPMSPHVTITIITPLFIEKNIKYNTTKTNDI